MVKKFTSIYQFFKDIMYSYYSPIRDALITNYNIPCMSNILLVPHYRITGMNPNSLL